MSLPTADIKITDWSTFDDLKMYERPVFLLNYVYTLSTLSNHCETHAYSGFLERSDSYKNSLRYRQIHFVSRVVLLLFILGSLSIIILLMPRIKLV